MSLKKCMRTDIPLPPESEIDCRQVMFPTPAAIKFDKNAINLLFEEAIARVRKGAGTPPALS